MHNNSNNEGVYGINNNNNNNNENKNLLVNNNNNYNYVKEKESQKEGKWNLIKNKIKKWIFLFTLFYLNIEFAYDQDKLNKEIQDLVADYNFELKKEKENKDSNSITKKSPNLDMDLNLDLNLSDIEEDENLINFMENLDYDKFVKNQEVREALYLLKNKVEKEKENENENKENPDGNENNNNNNNDQEGEGEILGEKIEETLINLPPIENKGGIIHDKDWDGKNLNEDSEILKKKLADKILKLDKVYFFLSLFLCFFVSFLYLLYIVFFNFFLYFFFRI